MRVLPLSGGKYVAIISKEDFRRVNRHNWHVHFSKGSKRRVGNPYARSNINGKKVYLHRFITNANEGAHVDHINHCTLDCRRCNLEEVPPIENIRRRRRVKP